MAELAALPQCILTPRLSLRLLTSGDSQAVFEAKQESWDDFWRWGIWMFNPKEKATLADDEKWCQHLHDRMQRGEKFNFLAFERVGNTLVGQGMLAPDAHEPGHYTIGYWVRSSETGRGYGSEIATALCYFALGALGASQLSSFHAAGNIGSQRVLEKTGFVQTKVLPAQHEIKTTGLVVDEIHYSLPMPERLPKIDVSW